MHSGNASSVASSRSGSWWARGIFAGVFLLALAATTQGQATSIATPKPGVKQPHWRKYLNRQYGFSFWYPGTYRATNADGICKDNEFRRYLVCLQQGDDPDQSIWVTLITAQPFHVYPGTGDVMPSRQRIGRHVFYCGRVGSMGVGYDDECIFDLKGLALEFTFSPSEYANSGETESPPMLKVLNTFRRR